jgi:plastocyanin
MSKRSLLVAVLTLTFALTGGAFGATHVVTVQDNLVFTPDVLTIHAGDAVEWQHVGSSISHTTTSGTGAADPNAGVLWDEPLNPGGSFTYTFDVPGTYDYFCRPHEGTGMTGQVFVVSAVSSTGTLGKAGLVIVLLFAGGLLLWRRQTVTVRS